MTTHSDVASRRATLLRRLFPNGVPRLWCPLLTHYRDDGAIDASRIEAHLRHLNPHVNSFLIPGSTGDGWALGPARTRELIDLALDLAGPLRLNLLIGVLHADAAPVLKSLGDITRRIQKRTGEKDPLTALAQAGVAGFTVCPPTGKREAEVRQAVSAFLNTGLPLALYQLPQVTQNEITPEQAAELAARFENFILFKDTSGTDAVMLSQKSLGGVFAVRGAEGRYDRWLEAAGGPYQGFLLSTANCFAREFRELIEHVSKGRRDQAAALSQRLNTVIERAFGLARKLPVGNPFANANKAIDHFFAYGHGATKVPPPRLYTGERMPIEILVGTERILDEQGMLPAEGYVEQV